MYRPRRNSQVITSFDRSPAEDCDIVEDILAIVDRTLISTAQTESPTQLQLVTQLEAARTVLREARDNHLQKAAGFIANRIKPPPETDETNDRATQDAV